MKLTSIEEVQKRVGVLPAPRDLKVIDHVDEHARRWLSYANFAFIGFGRAGNIQLTPAGSERAFATVVDSGHLQIPLAVLDDANIVEPGLSFGSLFMVSGMDETLRVNGTVSHVADGYATLKVAECYLHCAKSFRRSDFWLPSSVGQSQGELSDFIRQSRFLVLASINSRGEADVSPKGDPAHLLIQEDEGVLYLSDRPGNRRIDSFRNILEQPGVSVLALMPGCEDVLELRGKAELCSDDHLLQRFEINGKKPKLIIKIRPASLRIRPSPAITRSALWPSKKGPGDLVPSDIFKAHIQRSKDSSLKAKVARAAVSLPGAMEKGLELDYKKNLY
ncbi:pyridoxamine 5'-phosphate oxidase family protein [Marinobacter sp. M-5]|uniref:pyridoxamine 5'-phosphate oxidase family protein n=1 Tax=Marinobacter sp. M-5 TaxID=3081089 RepID=UPI00293C3097|nr:pyridoxamine 5'-phosphate oxidase family protein [Marinobacter sp. M-5]MDV3504374.1 pyridoxamine 5'-phosphate oxidase family protein [Marinobacter sp. M-5]